MGNHFPLMGIEFPLMGSEFPLMGNTDFFEGMEFSFPPLTNHCHAHEALDPTGQPLNQSNRFYFVALSVGHLGDQQVPSGRQLIVTIRGMVTLIFNRLL